MASPAGPAVISELMDSAPDRKRIAREIHRLLLQCRAGRARIATGGALRPEFSCLASWQSARLAWTHRDLLATDRYGAAAEFFLSDLYGDRDYSARDEDMERVTPIMVRLMPAGALASVALGLRLHALTQTLDTAMVRMLFERMAVGPRFDAEDYAEAYRRCDNAADRLDQIELVGQIGNELDRIVRHTLVYRLVRLSHRPAHMAGFGALQDFIERGFEAFHSMDGAEEFLLTVTNRERSIHEAILDGEAADTWAQPEARRG